MTKRFAVIDTETNWNDKVMFIGVIIANNNYKKTESRYYVLPKEASIGGMFFNTIYTTNHEVIEGLRPTVIEDLTSLLKSIGVDDLFAYNASFDKTFTRTLRFLLERYYEVAAYKQYNPHIPEYYPCCKTGRLRKGYGVEPMLKLLDVEDYCETHNVIIYARDELLMIRFLS